MNTKLLAASSTGIYNKKSNEQIALLYLLQVLHNILPRIPQNVSQHSRPKIWIDSLTSFNLNNLVLHSCITGTSYLIVGISDTANLKVKCDVVENYDAVC